MGEKNGGLPYPVMVARQEEERLLFFPSKTSANEKSLTLFIIALPTFFALHESGLLPLLCGYLHAAALVAQSELQFSVNLK